MRAARRGQILEQGKLELPLDASGPFGNYGVCMWELYGFEIGRYWFLLNVFLWVVVARGGGDSHPLDASKRQGM